MNKVVSTLMILLVILVLAFGVKLAYDWNQRGKEVEFVEDEKLGSHVLEKEEKPIEKTEKPNPKEEKKAEEKIEKREEKQEEKKEPSREELLLDKKSRKGNYWLMLDFAFVEKEEYYEITGTIYDATLYADWVDEIGSGGMEDGIETSEKSGLKGKNLTFYLPKSLKVEAEKLEGFEIKEKSLSEFFEGHFGTFLFENEGNRIIKILDWYMNYAG